MICIECGSDNAEVFFSEDIPCSHCGGTTELHYNVCNNCNLMWKTVDDEVISNSIESARLIDEFIDSDEEMDLQKFLTETMDHIINLNLVDSEITTMKDLVHKCLRCESISYEVKPRFYHCPECGFEWEVL